MVYALWSHGRDRCDPFCPSGFEHCVSSCVPSACSVTWAQELIVASHGCVYPVTPQENRASHKTKVGMDVYTLPCKMDHQQGPTGYHRRLCSMLCSSLDGRGVWGRLDTRICLAEPLCYLPETITILLIGCTPI